MYIQPSLIGIPQDTFRIILGQLDGRAVIRLMQTCRALKKQLDTEKMWEKLFREVNADYKTTCTNWKGAYARQALITRNIRCKNVPRTQLRDKSNVGLMADHWLEMNRGMYILHDKLTNKEQSIKKDLFTDSNCRFRFTLLKNNRFILNNHTWDEFNHFSNDHSGFDSFEIWEGNQLLYKTCASGHFWVFEDYLFHHTNETSIKVTHINSQKVLLNFPQEKCKVHVRGDLIMIFPAHEAKVHYFDGAGDSVIASYNLSAAVSNPHSYVRPIKSNEQYVVLQGGLDLNLWVFPINDPSHAFVIPKLDVTFQLIGNCVYARDINQPNRLHCYDLMTKQITQTYMMGNDERINWFLIRGNRILITSDNQYVRVFDLETAKELYCLSRPDEKKCCYAVLSHILYEKLPDSINFYRFATGEIIGKIAMSNKDVYLDDGHLFDSGSDLLYDLTQPLPKAFKVYIPKTLRI